jgi:hypothetical protein
MISFYSIKRSQLLAEFMNFSFNFKSSCLTQLCFVSRIRKANVRVLPVRVSATWIEYAHDTLTFAYFYTSGSVIRVQCCARYRVLILRQNIGTGSKNLHASNCYDIEIRGTHFIQYSETSKSKFRNFSTGGFKKSKFVTCMIVL